MKLPAEILNKIFTEDIITRKDLLQLQLTCRHWSPIAEKALYRFIDFGDDQDAYDVEQQSAPEVALKRVKLLIRTLVLPNNQSRFWIQRIQLGQMLSFQQQDNISQDPHFNIALLAHLCPNLCSLSAEPATGKFYQFLTQLHGDGYLQHLQTICWPELTASFNHVLWISYNVMLREFKNCIKKILILDPSNNGLPDSIALAKEHLITLDDLRDFVKLDSLHVLKFARLKLHQLESYIRKCASQVRHIEIQIRDERRIQDGGFVSISVAQPQRQVTKLNIMFHEPMTQDDMLCLMLHYPSLHNLEFAVNGPLDDASETVDIANTSQFFEYLFTIPHVDFDEIHLSINSIPPLVDFVARSIQVKTVRFSALDPKSQDQAVVSLQHRLKDPHAINSKNKLIKTDSCQFEVALISHAPQMLFSHVLNVFKAGDVEKLILGPQYIQDASLPLQITQDMIDAILDHYPVLKVMICTMIEFPQGAPTVLAPRRKNHLKTLALQNCVINSGYLVELSRRLEHVDELKYLDFTIDQYYLNSENAKICIHMPHTTFSTINLMFPAIQPYLIKITTANACIWIKTSRERGLASLSAEEYTQLANANGTYQVDLVCNAVNTVTTNYGVFDVQSKSQAK